MVNENLVSNYDELYDEVVQRQEELEFEYGSDSEYSEVKINEVLRDEFSGEEYKQILIDLGINVEKINLSSTDTKNSWYNSTDEKEKENLVKTLLKGKHTFNTDKRLRGWEEVGINKFDRKTFNLLPTTDILFILQFLEAIYSTPSVTGKLDRHVNEFDDSINTQLTNFANKLVNYPDKIVNTDEMTQIINMLLNESSVVRTAIITGRLGDLSRDMVIGSYNEKEEQSSKDKLDELKRKLM